MKLLQQDLFETYTLVVWHNHFLVISDKTFCASSSILLTNYYDIITTQPTHHPHLFTFTHLSTTKKEQDAVKHGILRLVCLGVCFTTPRRRGGPLFYFCTFLRLLSRQVLPNPQRRLQDHFNLQKSSGTPPRIALVSGCSRGITFPSAASQHKAQIRLISSNPGFSCSGAHVDSIPNRPNSAGDAGVTPGLYAPLLFGQVLTVIN